MFSQQELDLTEEIAAKIASRFKLECVHAYLIFRWKKTTWASDSIREPTLDV